MLAACGAKTISTHLVADKQEEQLNEEASRYHHARSRADNRDSVAGK
jgi:hypothetical protein